MILVLFDNGGTLIDDPFPVVIQALRSTWAESKILSNYFTQATFRTFLELWAKENATVDFPFASHFLQEERWIISALSQGMGVSAVDSQTIPFVSPIILNIYRKLAKEAIERQTQLPTLRSELSSLNSCAQVVLGVASNDRDYATRAMLSWAGLDTLFDAIVTSEKLSTSGSVIEKPNPLFFTSAEEMVLRQISRKSFRQKIYVGDNEKNDIEAARPLGYLTVRYFSGSKSATNIWMNSPDHTSATVSYRRPNELGKVIRSLIPT